MMEGADPLASKEDDNYLFRGYSDTGISPLEVTATLRSDHSTRVLILVRHTDTFQYLRQRIGEEMEKFPQYNKLAGLRAENLEKRATSETLPSTGLVGDFIRSGEEILCDLLSEDLWLFVKFYLRGSFEQKVVDIEAKVGKNQAVNYVLMVVERMAMSFWSSVCLKELNYYYVLSNIATKIVSTREIQKITADSPGQVIDDSLRLHRVKDYFTSSTVLVAEAEILTLEEQIAKNPNYALSKYEEITFDPPKEPSTQIRLYESSVSLIEGEHILEQNSILW
eukprot:TRINITY_DN3820_c0_g1_i2.p1 TRINITY_DN3820_c0_g1~~TRINITY_DN3820_c0_g1_i2.p1  ORF type:complete len:305 (-),score=97.12 TRINITY_DN3820_c0_g1_i2:1459-2298(-)